jgi:hypothetical protein
MERLRIKKRRKRIKWEWKNETKHYETMLVKGCYAIQRILTLRIHEGTIDDEVIKRRFNNSFISYSLIRRGKSNTQIYVSKDFNFLLDFILRRIKSEKL